MSRGRGTFVTLREVARVAGVSIGTASKALNGGGKLSEATRERVNACARELGFRPNDLAQSLHRGQSFTVGAISNDSFGRFAMPIMEGLEECLSDRAMSVFLCNAHDDPGREARHVESLLGRRVDGIVVTGRRADPRRPLQVRGAGVPVVYVYSQIDDPAALCLLPDDQGGAAIACEHLAGLGRRRIAHVTGPERFEAVRLRRAGFLATLARAGLSIDESMILNGDWSEEWGRRSLDALFRTKRRAPDAIFCGNDQIARGVVDGLRERGIGVPADVAVVGFDNWQVIAEACRPPLTTVDMNLRQLGREAGRRLIDLIAGKQHAGVHRLPCSLVVRASSGTPVAPRRRSSGAAP
jgi:LacI family transcriptional regulator